MSQQHRPRLAWGILGVVFVTAGAITLAGACDRVTSYSVTGSAAVGGPGAAGPGAGPGNVAATGPGAVSRTMVLGGVATCATSLYGQFAVAASELDAAVSAYAASPTPENETAARTEWLEAMALWQQAEVIRVGPAGPTTLPSGEGTRDLIYSWPLVSRCLVEQGIVAQKYASPNFAQTALVNTRGLAAAEYLLFYTGNDNACSSSASINAQGTWAALGAELPVRKRAYASVVATDVAGQAAALSAAWSDGFATTLSTAGASGSPFDSDQAAMNAVSDGMFYLENEVKDLKLGLVLGKIEGCETPTCPEDVESQYARVARDHVKNNLVGFRRVFEGCDEAADTGFDDLLRSAGAGDLADRMSADIAAAIAVADGLSSSDLVALVGSDPTAVDALHVAVKRVTDALKTDFVTILDLELPKSVEGDND
jgi:predicted lipoprotein